MRWKEFLDCCDEEVLKSKSRWRLLRLLKVRFFGSPNRQAVVMLRIGQLLKGLGFVWLSERSLNRLARRYGVHVGHDAQIGAGLKFPHPTSIVIGGGAEIGSNVRIFQQVTIGASPQKKDNRILRIGNNVTIYPGAKFVGNGCVGNNVLVGANAVVTKPFGDNIVLAGMPAKIIRSLNENDRTGSRKASMSRLLTDNSHE
ncbi:serine O-acetyltransferase [Halomonas korlensis]|uniref:Transferase hexapeptide (Six repeat-containing protein) n=1 Tax=Halomonas korlensis TaxID=463301 RepID=A0A1I7G430_9GAMM|nr:hypothetical protein [Halomonas korlensis]SFU43199.1 transferase hexapeptide (six repeat-containing protein) [Halomonas korlensis]